MFYFLWALKNLYRNKKQTLGICIFVIIVSLILFLNFAFLKGSQKQMRETTREYVSDISLRTRSEEYSLAEVNKRIESTEYKNNLEMIVSEYSIGGVNVISAAGYSNYASVEGYSENYFNWMQNNVEWIEGGPFFEHPAQAVIERSMAEDLAVSAGDRITVEYVTDEGAINTAVYDLSGIFIGNKYEHQNTVYVTLKEAQNLGLVEGDKINNLRIYLKDPENENLLRKIVDNELKDFSDFAYISVWKWEPERNLFHQIFQYAQSFIKIVIGLVTIVSLIILFFGIQNTFYLIFNKRANEISVLATYGMPFLKIYRVVFWETTVLFITGLLGGFLLSILLGRILSGVSMTHFSGEMVVVLGGPNLQFDFVLKNVLWLALSIFIVGIFSSLHSLQRYFRLEIREMVRGIK